MILVRALDLSISLVDGEIESHQSYGTRVYVVWVIYEQKDDCSDFHICDAVQDRSIDSLRKHVYAFWIQLGSIFYSLIPPSSFQRINTLHS